jgi:hypothetical protein
MKLLNWTVVLAFGVILAGAAHAQDRSLGSSRSNHVGRVVLGPQAKKIYARIGRQFKLIQDGTISGKITGEDGVSLKAILKNIKDQEAVFIRQNGTHDLTVDQAAQLNQLLNQNSAQLGETPVLTGATPGSTNTQ